MTADQDLFEVFFQTSKPYYLKRLANFQRGKRITFNFFPFFFGVFWFLYRKMYREAGIIFFAIFAETLIEELVLVNYLGEEALKLVTRAVLVALSVTLAFTGNYAYMRKASKTVSIAKAKFTDEHDVKSFLKRRGGISFNFVIMLAVAIVAVSVLLACLDEF